MTKGRLLYKKKETFLQGRVPGDEALFAAAIDDEDEPIDDARATGCVVRPMTAEEWAKYGPPSPQKRRVRRDLTVGALECWAEGVTMRQKQLALSAPPVVGGYSKKRSPRRWTRAELEQIIALHQEGVNYRQIALRVGRHPSSIYQLLPRLDDGRVRLEDY